MMAWTDPMTGIAQDTWGNDLGGFTDPMTGLGQDYWGNTLGGLFGADPGINWSQGINGLLTAGSGLYDLFGSGGLSMQGIADRAALASDPFAPQRGQYQGMLQSLMTNPSSFSLSPAAQGALSIGTENLQRTGAAQGLLGSGNLLAELMGYGTRLASQDYYQQANLLAQLAGANTGSPAMAGQNIAALYGQRSNAMANVGGGSTDAGGSGILGGIGSAIGGLLGGLF